MKTGFYSKRETVRVDKLVEKYREEGLNPDNTDEDMLYLRAYLEQQKLMGPDFEELEGALATVLAEVLMWASQRFEVEPGVKMSVRSVLEGLGRLQELDGIIEGLTRSLTEARRWLNGVEARHANLVKLEKVRAESRLKNAAAGQLDLFTLMVKRFRTLLSETIPADYVDALDARIEQELKEVPVDLVTGAASVQA